MPGYAVRHVVDNGRTLSVTVLKTSLWLKILYLKNDDQVILKDVQPGGGAKKKNPALITEKKFYPCERGSIK